MKIGSANEGMCSPGRSMFCTLHQVVAPQTSAVVLWFITGSRESHGVLSPSWIWRDVWTILPWPGTQYGCQQLRGFWLTGGMKERLGLEEFTLTIWEQDGAKPHQVNRVDYLDGIFGKRMLALKSRWGNSWSPSSPNMNPCAYWLWGYMKEHVYRQLRANLHQFKTKIREVFTNIPDEIVRKLVYTQWRKERNSWLRQICEFCNFFV